MHALKRSSQRSIKHSVLDLIFNEGEASYNIMKSGRKKNTILI